MKFNRLLFILSALLFIQSCLPSYIDRTRVDTRFSGSQRKDTVHIKKLFVLSGGNISSKLIVDNLFAALADRMKENKSAATLEFIDHSKDYKRQEALKSIPADSFDGYLVVSSNESTDIDPNREKFTFNLPTPSGYWINGASYGSSYDGILRLSLYDSGKELIYIGVIVLHFDPSKKNLYSNVVLKFLKELSKANIALW